MLKIVYPFCCGMDVHKSFLVACIASTNNQGVTTYKSKRFSTFTGDVVTAPNGLRNTIARMFVWSLEPVKGNDLSYLPASYCFITHGRPIYMY